MYPLKDRTEALLNVHAPRKVDLGEFNYQMSRVPMLQAAKAVLLGNPVGRGRDRGIPMSSPRPGNSRGRLGAVRAGGVDHDDKLRKKLQGRDVMVSHGLAVTLAEFDALTWTTRSGTGSATPSRGCSTDS